MMFKIEKPSASHIEPVALNRDVNNPIDRNQLLTVIGFGLVKEGGSKLSEKLRKVDLQYVPHNKCNRKYSGDIKEDSMLCAGIDAGGKDSCQGGAYRDRVPEEHVPFYVNIKISSLHFNFLLQTRVDPSLIRTVLRSGL
jgi:hypothetical protein